MSISKELDTAKAYYKRAQKDRDIKEMRRQAREIKQLAIRLASIMGVAS